MPITVDNKGSSLSVKEGSNARMGVVTLVAGEATVETTAVAANSRIFLTENAPGGSPGHVSVSARTPGVSFTIMSSSNGDESEVAWIIVSPE